MPRACAMLPTCLRKREDSENAPPPPPPSPTPTRKKGEDGEETARGHGKKKKKNTKRTTKDSNTPGQGQAAGADGAWREPGGTARGAGQRPWGSKLGGRDQRGGGRGDKSPRTTLVRYPTSGVWGPPQCPYRPHLSASNKVGYARDRWPAARGGTGLGGWPMGLTKSTPHGTYCGSCPVRGCG